MMAVWFEEARRRFHASCLSGPITMTKGIPSIADVSNGPSREISIGLIAKLGQLADHAQKPPGQTAGAMFESVCLAFLEESLARLAHVRPGTFRVAKGRTISQFEQYAHLDELRILADASRELKTLLGTDYLIKPDVVVIKDALSDGEINQTVQLVDKQVAQRTALRASNGAKATLHASVSCKLTIRSDRVQNTRSEALNLLRNRKGRAPHIVAVTAEPTPSRIAAIALGTGDIDCVYHFALPELVEVLKEQERDSLDLVETMINGKRLRDIADLPFDLAI
jgi:NgoMIV restriction enzyme